MPIRDLHSAQLGSGKPRISSLHLIAHDLVLARQRLAPGLAGSVFFDPEWFVIMVPLGWRVDYRFNGQTAQPCDIFLSGSKPGGFFGASGVRHTWLSRSFNNVYGTSPVKYIRNRRLSEARNRFLIPMRPQDRSRMLRCRSVLSKAGALPASFVPFLANVHPSLYW